MKRVMIVLCLAILTTLLFACKKDEVDDITYLLFDTKGGTEIEKIYFENELEVNVPNIPVKDGYIFEGWYKDEEFKQRFLFLPNIKITETTILHAKWRENTTDFTKSFKVLSIGNSFSKNAHTYLWSIAKSYGIDPENIIIGNLYFGGGSIKNHYDLLTKDMPAQEYQKYTSPNLVTTTNVKFIDAVKDENWDVITFQQGSGESGKPETYDLYLDYLIRVAKEQVSNPNVIIGWHLTWAYDEKTNHASFPDYDSNQLTMFNAIINATKQKILTNYEFNFVIPNGVAVQNARTSYLSNKLLTGDGYHLLSPVGTYLASLTFFKGITNFEITPENIDFAPEGISESDKMVLFEAVNNAFINQLVITNSKFPE